MKCRVVDTVSLAAGDEFDLECGSSTFEQAALWVSIAGAVLLLIGAVIVVGRMGTWTSASSWLDKLGAACALTGAYWTAFGLIYAQLTPRWGSPWWITLLVVVIVLGVCPFIAVPQVICVDRRMESERRPPR